MTAREISGYVRDAFYTYEAMRDARDEALTRCCELEDQRDQARRAAASLEAEVAEVRAIHRPIHYDFTRREWRDGMADGPPGEQTACDYCGGHWPCRTATAVYLP